MEEADDDIGISDPGGLALADSDLMMEKVVSKLNAQTTADAPPKKKKPHKNRKPADAPKRFKSSFIFFSMAKHKEIKEKLAGEGESTKATNITKMVSDAWRNMGAEEREKYEEFARRDKDRYNLEKASYVAPPGHGSSSKRKRDPDAPKRPMSAYLAYANKRRAEVKAQNPDCSNGEISKILSTMWKDAPDELKQRFKDEEHALWDTYKDGMVEWRKKNDGRKKIAKSDVAGDVSRAADSAKGGKSKRAKKGKDKASLADEFSPEDHDGGPFVDDHQLGLGGPSGFMDGTGNPNPEEMMAASALRGVRGGPAQPHLMAGHGGMGDFGNQFQSQNAGSGGYGAFLGMNGMNNINAMTPMMGGGNPGNGGGFGQLDMPAFPYNQYGGYSLGGNPQAMLMAQLRGATTNPYQQYPGFLSADQQQNLSQLASLAGTQNASGMQMGQPPAGMNMGMGGLMNDNSGGGMNRHGDMQGGMAPF